mgnify:CR=1 FL=1
MTFLSQEEVDALPTGTKVSICWSGGNGPHEYEVASVEGRAFTRHPLIMHRIDFVGSEPYHTKVRRIFSPVPSPPE